MRLSLSLAILSFIAGSRVLANSAYDAYELDARDLDVEDLEARYFPDTYLDVDSRDLSFEDLEDINAREYLDSLLWERDVFGDNLDKFVARDLYDDSLSARYYDELEERQFDDYEPDFITREEGFESELEAREPLRYRIGIVIPNHDN